MVQAELRHRHCFLLKQQGSRCLCRLWGNISQTYQSHRKQWAVFGVVFSSKTTSDVSMFLGAKKRKADQHLLASCKLWTLCWGPGCQTTMFYLFPIAISLAFKKQDGQAEHCNYSLGYQGTFSTLLKTVTTRVLYPNLATARLKCF